MRLWDTLCPHLFSHFYRLSDTLEFLWEQQEWNTTWRERHSNSTTLYHQGHISAFGPVAQRVTLHLLPTAHLLSLASSVKSFPPLKQANVCSSWYRQDRCYKSGWHQCHVHYDLFYRLYSVSLNSVALTTDSACQKCLDVIILNWWHLMCLNMECNWNAAVMQEQKAFMSEQNK